MRLKRRNAAIQQALGGRPRGAGAVGCALLAAVVGALMSCASAEARGLSVGLRIRQEFYQPLVPVSRAFKTCFKPDAEGRPALVICPEEKTTRPERSPARVEEKSDSEQGVPQ